MVTGMGNGILELHISSPHDDIAIYRAQGIHNIAKL